MTSVDTGISKCDYNFCSPADMNARLTPCLPSVPISRCSSLLLDQCKSKLSCGSLSPISPCPPLVFPDKHKDVKIIVTDTDILNNNNDSVFTDCNDPEKDNIQTDTVTQRLVGSSLMCSSRSLPCPPVNNSSSSPRVAVMIWASLSTAVLGTCIGLAICLTSINVGIMVSLLGLSMIVFVILISYRVFRVQSRRSGYERLGGSNYCNCSPSMPNIFYQCSHERSPNNRRGSTASDYSYNNNNDNNNIGGH